MRTTTFRRATICIFFFGLSVIGYTQNPILRSTTTGIPTSISQIQVTNMVQVGTKFGIGTTTPSQLFVLNKISTVGSHGDYYSSAPPTIRFENQNLAGIWRYWHLAGGDEFRLSNEVTSQIPLKINQSGDIQIMESIALNEDVVPVNLNHNNRITILSKGGARKIQWSTYTYNGGGDNLAIPLEFAYDAINQGGTDVSVMKLMPSGQVRLGNLNTLYQNFVLGSAANTNSSIRLTVDGNVAAKGFIATQQNWADFVFYAPEANPTLQQEETSIQENCTLVGVPTEAEVAQGRDLAENDALLLQKLEQLYLHVIELNKQMTGLNKQLQLLQLENEQLKAQVNQK